MAEGTMAYIVNKPCSSNIKYFPLSHFQFRLLLSDNPHLFASQVASADAMLKPAVRRIGKDLISQA
jgi:hypothetical protein